MIKGIVFDKDGTVLDYESFWIPVAEGAVSLLLDKIGESGRLAAALDAIGTYDGIKGVLCHGTYGNIADSINDALGKSYFDGETVGKAFSDSVGLAKVSPTCDNIRGVFEKLHEDGLTVALITSDNASLTEFCLSELNILDLFDKIYTDDGIHPSKPDPYYMHSFCSEFGFEPCEVIMVGDTMTDVDFAKNSGCHSIGVGRYAPELLYGKADHIAPDISYVREMIEKYNCKVK